MRCVIKQCRSIRTRDAIRSGQQRRADSIRTGTGRVNPESNYEADGDFIPKVRLNKLQKRSVIFRPLCVLVTDIYELITVRFTFTFFPS